MESAISEAKIALAMDEVPVGCIVVCKDVIVGSGYNLTKAGNTNLNHAEIIALGVATKNRSSGFLDDCDVYVTLEPCAMCAAAISLSRVKRVYFGCYDFKAGALGGAFNLYSSGGVVHVPDVYGGMAEEECSSLLSNFFKSRR